MGKSTSNEPLRDTGLRTTCVSRMSKAAGPRSNESLLSLPIISPTIIPLWPALSVGDTPGFLPIMPPGWENEWWCFLHARLPCLAFWWFSNDNVAADSVNFVAVLVVDDVAAAKLSSISMSSRSSSDELSLSSPDGA